MAGSLEGPFAKLRRAELQMQSLKAEIDDVWPPLKRWPLRTEERTPGFEYRFYLGELPRVDPDWLLWTGEIMFNLRSALDHLAYQLHVRRFRGAVPPRVEARTQFPIYPDATTFDNNAYRIATLSSRDRRALRHLQPDVTRNDRWWETRFWLGKLNSMHNIDKHRKLHAVAATRSRAAVPRFPPEVGCETWPVWGAVESHSHVETWTFAKPPPELLAPDGALLEVTLNPEGEEWVGLIPFLEETSKQVRRAILRFADRFPPL